MSYPAKNIVPVPGVIIEQTFKSMLFEAPDGRHFWVSNRFIRIYGDVEYMLKEHVNRLHYIRTSKYRRTLNNGNN